MFASVSLASAACNEKALNPATSATSRAVLPNFEVMFFDVFIALPFYQFLIRQAKNLIAIGSKHLNIYAYFIRSSKKSV
jgi:hypothetical protein